MFYWNHPHYCYNALKNIRVSRKNNSDLLEIYKNYSRLSIDYLTFTKLDETRSFGNLISFAHKTKKSITYFSIGQNVPDDLIVSDSTFLIDCFNL